MILTALFFCSSCNLQVTQEPTIQLNPTPKPTVASTATSTATPKPATPTPTPPSTTGTLINGKVKWSNSPTSQINAVIYLPAAYDPNRAYPLVMFFHGTGEAGTDVNVMYNNGLPKVLKAGYVPPFDFIMVAPQAPSYGVNPPWLPYILADMKSRYKIDLERIYLTGLSAGGWATWGSQMNVDQNFGKNFAALVPLSAATQDVDKTKFDWWITTLTPSWAIVGGNDLSYKEQNQDMVAQINSRVPGLAKIDVRAGIGHGGWDEIYNGTFKNSSGQNIWQWMYQYTRSTTASATPTPSATPTVHVLMPTAPNNEVYRPSGQGLDDWKPGDTVQIPAGHYSLIDLGNFQGAEGKPITLVNSGGLVTVDTFRIRNGARYVRLLGNGDASVTRGIKIVGNGGGVCLASTASDLEVGYVEASSCDVGFYIKRDPKVEDPTTIYPNDVMKNISIHHSYIHDVNGEGMYIGHTYPNADPYHNNMIPIRLDHVEIANNVVERTGWDGIQLSNARENCSIHHNQVSNFGLSNIGSQQAGIILGGNTNGDVYGNTVKGGTGNGIEIFGFGLVHVTDNWVEETGMDGTTTGQEAIYTGDRPLTVETNPKLQLVVSGNTIKNVSYSAARRGAVRITDYNNGLTLASTVQNNTFMLPGLSAGNWVGLYILAPVGSTVSGNILNP